MRTLIALSFVLFTIFGCADTYNIGLTGFGGQSSYTHKTYDFALTPDIKTDLEAMGYVEMLEKQLACTGWVRKAESPDFIIAPAFGTIITQEEPPSKSGFSGSFGIFGGSVGSGVSVGSLFGTPGEPQYAKEYKKFLNIKMFADRQTDSPPVWQGKIFSKNENKTLADVMPVLIKYAVENFGKNTEGSKEYTFDASKENLKALEGCPAE